MDRQRAVDHDGRGLRQAECSTMESFFSGRRAFRSSSRFSASTRLRCQRGSGSFFAIHWSDHVDQLVKIRKAVGLPEAALVQR